MLHSQLKSWSSNSSNCNSYSFPTSSYYSDNSNSYHRPIKFKDLYHKLKSIQVHIKYEANKYDSIITLTQKDFKNGTYRINCPGYYILEENIIFNPNPDNDYKPYPYDNEYYSLGYSLGFFAAITIETSNVVLDLNGFTISQSKEHALQQRFFAIIELADRPFIPGQGPGNFGDKINSASNCIIRNGVLGLSSHHSIHGNYSKNILLENLVMKDFEICGPAINGGNNIVLKRLKVGPNRKDVPVLATYSAGRFVLQFAKMILAKYSNDIPSSLAQQFQNKINNLNNRMNNVFDEVMSKGYTTDELFANPITNVNGNNYRLPDGNNYGILFHPPGIAVNEFVEDNFKGPFTNNVFLNEIEVFDLDVKVNEIIGISNKDGTDVQMDAAGSVFQIDSPLVMENGVYVGKIKGNDLSELQIATADISIRLNLNLGKMNISQDLVDWATKSRKKISDLLDMGYVFKCSGDSMFHLNKGISGYRFDGVHNLNIRNCKLRNINNFGRLGSDSRCGNYTRSHDQQVLPGYHGADANGYNLSHCTDIYINNISAKNIFASNGQSRAIRFMNLCKNIYLNKICINHIKAGLLFDNGVWLGESYNGNNVIYKSSLPNMVPSAIGIKIDSNCKNVKIGKRKIGKLSAPGCAVPIWTS